MFKHILVAFATIFLINNAAACDLCSASSLNVNSSQLLQNNKSFVGIGYLSTSLESAEKNKYQVHQFIVHGAYAIKSRWQTRITIPLQNQIIHIDNQKNTAFGIGDITTTLSYKSVSKNNSVSQHGLFHSVGIKLPTGKFETSEVIAPMGSGSLDFLLGSEYVFTKNNMGLLAKAEWKINTQNRQNYKYGDQGSFGLTYFLKQNNPRISIMPFLGLSYEMMRKDHSNSFLRLNSGGEALNTILGIQWIIKEAYVLNFRSDIPVVQKFDSSEGEVIFNPRLQAQFIYLFNKKNTNEKSNINNITTN